jgi:hypothetical protein
LGGNNGLAEAGDTAEDVAALVGGIGFLALQHRLGGTAMNALSSRRITRLLFSLSVIVVVKSNKNMKRVVDLEKYKIY